MIERFLLPEGLPPSAEDLIREAGAGALDSSRDFPQRLEREDQNVHVVRHDNPGEEVAKLPLVSCHEESFDYGVGDFWISQPRRTGEVHQCLV